MQKFYSSHEVRCLLAKIELGAEGYYREQIRSVLSTLMDQPWYREYFWLLVFGGIILFAGIISFIMVCVCRTQFSRRITLRIQKSFRYKRKSSPKVPGFMGNGVYGSSVQILALPDEEIAPYASRSAIDHDSVHFRDLYAQKRLPALHHVELTNSGIGHIAVPHTDFYAKTHKRPQPLHHAEIAHPGFGLNPLHSTELYAKANKRKAPTHHTEISYDNKARKTDSYSNVSHEYEESRHSDNGYIDVILEGYKPSAQHTKVSSESQDDEDYDDIEIPHDNYGPGIEPNMYNAS